MRTRRSPRNQEILWRDLGRQGQPPPEPRREPVIKTDEEIDRIPFLSERTRRMMKRDSERARKRAAFAKALVR